MIMPASLATAPFESNEEAKKIAIVKCAMQSTTNQEGLTALIVGRVIECQSGVESTAVVADIFELNKVDKATVGQPSLNSNDSTLVLNVKIDA